MHDYLTGGFTANTTLSFPSPASEAGIPPFPSPSPSLREWAASAPFPHPRRAASAPAGEGDGEEDGEGRNEFFRLGMAKQMSRGLNEFKSIYKNC